MRRLSLFVLMAAPTLLACSTSSPAKKVTDAATDPVALADRATDTTSMGGKDAWEANDSPVKDAASADSAAADSPAVKDATAADVPAADATALKDGMASDPLAPADVFAADIANRDSATVEALRDVAADVPFSCLSTPSAGPPCNDEPISAAVQGVCQSDGTCLCNTGFTLNPNTGRCGYRKWDAAVDDGATAALMCTGTYDACQCLCCSTDQLAPTCYFPTLGETADAIRTAYEASKNPANCGPGSCSRTIVRYVCCTPADPEPSSSATYVATGGVGGIDHLNITKTGANCVSLSFADGTRAQPALNIDSGGDWAVSAGSFGPCGDASAQTQIQGALGTMTFRKDGSDCVADLHATLFAIDDAGTITTARMDGDGIKMPRVLSVMSCH